VGNDPAIKLSKPPRVFVVSDDCASDVMTVAVPDVVGKRLAEARRLVEATDLKVASFSTYRTDGAPDNARIEAQVPAAGAIVSRGSCMGLRAR
jgi:beta-lactam-binding protein with PASTA domain